MTEFEGIHTDFEEDTDKKQLRGVFTMDFKTGKVSLVVEDKNAEWADVRKAYEAIVKEFQQQIDNRAKCPFSDGS